MKAKLAEQGIVAVGDGPDEFRVFVADEIGRWSKVITDAGIKMNDVARQGKLRLPSHRP